MKLAYQVSLNLFCKFCVALSPNFRIARKSYLLSFGLVITQKQVQLFLSQPLLAEAGSSSVVQMHCNTEPHL